MKISNLKKLNEKIPDWMKMPFAPLIRYQLIHNRTFINQYHELEKSNKLTEHEQVNMAKKCLINAYEHTLYYHRMFDEIEFDPYGFCSIKELEKIPVLTKEVLQKEYNNLSADNVTNYYEVSTGGTSGKPIKILMDKQAIYKEWAFVYHYWSKYGYDFNSSRLATLRGVDFNGKKYKYNPLYAEIRLNPFLMGDDTIKEYVRKIRNYQADFLYGYPSAIYNFCRLCLKHGISIKDDFKAVFLISENLYSYQEEVINKATEAPIAIFYGHSERAVFAEKNKIGGYIFNPYYGMTEINEKNEIVATGFINPKMPLIRYIVDDSAIQLEDGTYEIVGHHSSEVLYGENGIQISMAAFNVHDDTFKNIEAYQFVQNVIGECELHIVSDVDVNLFSINQKVQEKLGKNIRCTVMRKENIQYTNRGKYKMIIQNCKNAVLVGGRT